MPEYIQKVLKFKKPTNTKEYQQYRGVLQYIAMFLHKLHEWESYLKGFDQLKKGSRLKWTKQMDYAFDRINELVAQAPLLAHPTEEDPFLVQTDASGRAISGVLFQYNRIPKQVNAGGSSLNSTVNNWTKI